MTSSVWAEYRARNYPHVFDGTLRMTAPICGGVPSDQRVAEGFLKTKLGDRDDQIRAAVAELMAERGMTLDEATAELVDATRLNGFKRDPQRDGQLYVGGYQLKACLKEAASVAANAGNLSAKGWGTPDNANYKKGLKAWAPEHIFVVENRLYLRAGDGEPVTEPTGIAQRFVRTGRGVSGIQYEEFVENCEVDFTVETDFDFEEKQWAAIWVTAEHMGVGATRSMGYGTFEVVKWERREAPLIG